MQHTLTRSTTRQAVIHRHRDLGIPASWYRVAWSSEVRDDSILSLQYFGAELICFRSSEGVAKVFDAHCPHLGAHLGQGCLKDGEVRCPFHGWRWNSDGANTLIPYADTVAKLSLRAWNVAEVNGVVWVWYDSTGQTALVDDPKARSVRLRRLPRLLSRLLQGLAQRRGPPATSGREYR